MPALRISHTILRNGELSTLSANRVGESEGGQGSGSAEALALGVVAGAGLTGYVPLSPSECLSRVTTTTASGGTDSLRRRDAASERGVPELVRKNDIAYYRAYDQAW